MSWHNSGAWSGLKLRPNIRTILAELCWAVNEREAAVGHGGYSTIVSITRSGTTATIKQSGGAAVGTTRRVCVVGADQAEYNGMHTIESVLSPTLPSISSITRSGSTATVTFASAHGLTTSETITISGATQTEYNGTFAIASTPTSTILTYAVTGTPATPATGTPTAVTQGKWEYTVSGSPASPATTSSTLRYGLPLTEFMYNADEDTKWIPVADDFEDLPVHRVTPAAQSVTSIVQSLGTNTVRLPGHGRRVGDYVKIAGAAEDGYNGEFTVSAVPGSISLTGITRSGSTATATSFAAHGLVSGDVVFIAGVDQTEYNGAFFVTVTGSTTFTYTISGTPATPATGGAMTMKDYSRFDYTSTSASPSASGTLTAQGRRTHVYYATWSGGTGTVYARNHGFSTGDWVHVQHDSDSTWRLWVQVASATTGSFTFTHTGSLSAATYSSTAGFWCAKPVGVRQVVQQIRSAIETMLEPFTFRGYVTNDAVYETQMDLATALSAGSFGSSWLSIVNCERNAVGDVLEQIREALEEIIYARANISATGNVNYTTKAGTGSSRAAAWSDMVAASESSSSTTGFEIGGISMERSGTSVYDAGATTSAEIEYEWIGLPGTFVYAALQAYELHSGDVDQDAMEVVDDDGDTWTFDMALGAPTYDLITVEKTADWFTNGGKQYFGFATTLPGSHPFDSMSSVGDTAQREGVASTGPLDHRAGFLIYDISSDLTYG